MKAENPVNNTTPFAPAIARCPGTASTLK
ncbi:Protein of unknown function [Propionibacterium freudenreichii]|nr:Protein of unknown function [Propionibacterium freudenreichii]